LRASTPHSQFAPFGSQHYEPSGSVDRLIRSGSILNIPFHLRSSLQRRVDVLLPCSYFKLLFYMRIFTRMASTHHASSMNDPQRPVFTLGCGSPSLRRPV